MRVVDYMIDRLIELGVRHAFLVTGGGAMHLNDALGRGAGLRLVPMHHEQSAAMAAEAYARLCGRPAIVNVTTGPGGINALNGVYGAYTDSIPMIVISGQVKREAMVRSYDLPLRQIGDQEVDIVRIVEGITKMAVVLDDPQDVRAVVETAFRVATTGRPGPVWIDVPIDVQAALIDPEMLKPAQDLPAPAVHEALPSVLQGVALDEVVGRVAVMIAAAERPIILAGTGLRISGAYEGFRRLVDQVGIPVATAWNAHDVLPNDHPLYAGRPGTVGDRAGNFAVQNADLVLVLGCRLNIRQISYNWLSFARQADIVMVDIDPAEIVKPTLSIDVPVCADLADFIPKLAGAATAPTPSHRDFVAWCRARLANYPVVLPSYWDDADRVNPYCFVEALFDRLEPGDVVVTGDGTACVVTFQAAKLKERQRLFTNSGSASMGYDIPAAIGAAFAGGTEPNGRLICLAGDGSAMMNIQELATVAGWKLPIKIFLLNNDGYHSIRQTQQNYFPDNVVGCGPESGLFFPSFVDVAKAFGIEGRQCGTHEDLAAAIDAVLTEDGPQLCEVLLDKRQQFSPKLSSRKLEDGRMVSSPLEDMFPFLPREEFAANMLIDLVE